MLHTNACFHQLITEDLPLKLGTIQVILGLIPCFFWKTVFLILIGLKGKVKDYPWMDGGTKAGLMDCVVQSKK